MRGRLKRSAVGGPHPEGWRLVAGNEKGLTRLVQEGVGWVALGNGCPCDFLSPLMGGALDSFFGKASGVVGPDRIPVSSLRVGVHMEAFL